MGNETLRPIRQPIARRKPGSKVGCVYMCPLRRCRRLRRWIGKGFFFPPGERCGTALPAVENKKLSCRTETARCFVSLSHSRSLKVIENGTIRKFGYSFLFIFHRIYAVSLAVWTQYTNVTHTRQTPHDGMLRLCIASRGKNGIFLGWNCSVLLRFWIRAVVTNSWHFLNT